MSFDVMICLFTSLCLCVGAVDFSQRCFKKVLP